MAENLNLLYGNIYSQRGEDKILEEIFNRLDIKNGFFIEVGGADGKEFSNCFNLISTRNFGGIYVEGDKKLYKQLVENIKPFKNVYGINEYISPFGYNKIDSILDRNCLLLPEDGSISLLNLDIDGDEYRVLQGLEINLPTVLVVECNPYVSPLLEYLHKLDTPHVQESLYMFQQLGKSKGYTLIGYTQNAVFVKDEYAHLFDTPDNLIDIFMNGFVASYMREDDPKMYERVLRNIKNKYKLDNNWLYKLLRERNLI